QEEFQVLLDRRVKGEPVAYLVGHKEFWSHDFLITPDVLIPRADTELIVEIALEQMEGRQNLRVLDLGTGSGAIALSIAAERPDVAVVATDLSPEALQVAQINAKQFQISNVEFALGGWYEALTENQNKMFDLILSNPPYIAKYDPHLAQGDLRFEPNTALMAGVHGMDDLHVIISRAHEFLAPAGLLLVEHGYDQEQLVAKEFAQAGFAEVGCYKDLAGIPRVTMGVRV
ncbi:MAG TPA: peptide chain release factor N(5)-glutamine methyltransferase, partial [Gammaproteobacteria bacterium]|nr:peptide chain release factor N(5)-glutamine methyltransferase [Gammaproteobacteria bacterium]